MPPTEHVLALLISTYQDVKSLHSRTHLISFPNQGLSRSLILGQEIYKVDGGSEVI